MSRLHFIPSALSHPLEVFNPSELPAGSVYEIGWMGDWYYSRLNPSADHVAFFHLHPVHHVGEMTIYDTQDTMRTTFAMAMFPVNDMTVGLRLKGMTQYSARLVRTIPEPVWVEAPNPNVHHMVNNDIPFSLQLYMGGESPMVRFGFETEGAAMEYRLNQ